jgi:hypothetical protein
MREIVNFVAGNVLRGRVWFAKLRDGCVVRSFKALKQTMKFYYRIGYYKEMMDAYREMLTYIKSTITCNYREKCINNILDSM